MKYTSVEFLLQLMTSQCEEKCILSTTWRQAKIQLNFINYKYNIESLNSPYDMTTVNKNQFSTGEELVKLIDLSPKGKLHHVIYLNTFHFSKNMT